jgi:hypothetical protein
VSASLHHHRGERPRDPRLDPAVGDHVEKGGLCRRVTEATSKAVGWVILGMADGSGSSSIEQWRRWSKGALVRRDIKPDSAPAHALREDDARVLCTLHDFSMADGWTYAPPKALHEAAKVSRSGFQRCVTRLKDSGLVVSKEGGARTGDRYQLTAAGGRLHDSLGPHDCESGPHGAALGRMVRPTGPHGTGDDDVSFSPISKEEKDKDRSSSTAEGGPHLGPHGDLLGRMDPSLLVEVIRQQRLVLELLEGALAGRLPPSAPAPSPAPAPAATPARPSTAPTASPNEHGDEPCKLCHAPTVRRRNDRDEPFLGCSRFPACKETRSIRDPNAAPKRRPSRHAWAPALEAELERKRRENGQPTPVTDARELARAALGGRAS